MLISLNKNMHLKNTADGPVNVRYLYSANHSDQDFNVPVNIFENDKTYNIFLLAPGYKKDDLEVDLYNGGHLHIQVKAEEAHESDRFDFGENYLLREFIRPVFSRSFVLPADVYTDEIEAYYESGILKIILPKKRD